MAETGVPIEPVGAPGHNGEVPALPVADHPLVGRDADLAELVARLDAGTSSVVLLGGDAGVGKTRLLTEFTARAQEADALVLLGHCLDLGDSGAPYLPLVEMFARLHEDRPERVAELAQSYPRLAPVLPDAVRGEVSAADPAGFFAEVHGALDRLAADGPLLVLLEDAHWADRSTRELLTFLLSRRSARPLLLVVSYRADDLHRRHPLRRNLAEWSRLPGVHRQSLAPLPDDDIRALLGQLEPGPAGPAGPHETSEIVRRAGGNPFFAEELLAAQCLGDSGLPDDLADLLLVRIDALGDDAREVVRVASTAGRAVDHDLLAAASGLEPAALDAGLRALLDAQVLTASGTGYAFRHALLGDAVYDDLLPGERLRLHGAFVDALQHADRSPARDGGQGLAAAIARHARAAGRRDVAVAAAVQAGDEAAAASGPADAAQLYQHALELVLADPGLPTPLSPFEITLRAASALVDSGDPYRAIDLLSDLDAPGSSAFDQGRLALCLAEAHLLTDAPESLAPRLQSAIEALAGEPSPVLASLHAKRARALFDDDDFEGSAQAADEAIQLARELELPSVTADALTTLARLDSIAGLGERSLERLDEVVRRAAADGDVEAELRARHQRHRVLARLDDHAGARDEAAAAVRRAGELGAATNWFALDCRILAALFAVLTGDWRLAEEMLDVRRLGVRESPTTAPLAAIDMALAAARGERETVLDRVEAIRPAWEREMMVSMHGGGAAIDVLGRDGEIEAMLALHDEVVGTVRRVWHMRSFDARIRLSAVVIGHLATARIEQRDARRRDDWSDLVAELAATAEDVAGLRADESSLGLESRAWLARARAERLRHDWGGRGAPPPELVERLRESAELFTEASFPYEQARVRVLLAEVLAAAGDQSGARAEAATARDLALELGARGVLERVGHRGKAPRSPAGAGTAPELTPREREVLALVARGRTNGEIAKELFISTKTASVHVSNILAKLGAATRTEAATLATKQGLLGE